MPGLAIVFDLSIQSLEAAFVRCIDILWTLFVVAVSRTWYSRACDCSKLNNFTIVLQPLIAKVAVGFQDVFSFAWCLLQWLKCDQCDYETLKAYKLYAHKDSHKYPLGVDCPVCNRNVKNAR